MFSNGNALQNNSICANPAAPPNFYRSNTVSLVSDDFIPVCKSMILVIYLYIFAENTIITDFNAF